MLCVDMNVHATANILLLTSTTKAHIHRLLGFLQHQHGQIKDVEKLCAQATLLALGIDAKRLSDKTAGRKDGVEWTYGLLVDCARSVGRGGSSHLLGGEGLSDFGRHLEYRFCSVAGNCC